MDEGEQPQPRRRRKHWTMDTGALPRPVTGRPPPIRKLSAVNIDMHFQPIVDLNDGSTFAHEALVRCRVEGLQNPMDLINQAVSEQAVGRLGRTIREVTMARANGQPIFTNLHPEELSSRWLVRPDDPLSLYEGDLYLEITESAALEYFDLCSSVLRELCARTGARLVVDDFGAGFSNLKRVVDLQPAVVKLDRALIQGIDENTRQRTLVEYLVKTMVALDATVVAEGIETEGELDAVRACGAHYGQGYLFARPAWPLPEVYWPKR